MAYLRAPPTISSYNVSYPPYNSYARQFAPCWQERQDCKRCLRNVAERGKYHVYLERWFAQFGRERFLVLQTDMLWEEAGAERVKATLEAVGRFLRLDGNVYRQGR